MIVGSGMEDVTQLYVSLQLFPFHEVKTISGQGHTVPELGAHAFGWRPRKVCMHLLIAYSLAF